MLEYIVGGKLAAATALVMQLLWAITKLGWAFVCDATAQADLPNSGEAAVTFWCHPCFCRFISSLNWVWIKWFLWYWENRHFWASTMKNSCDTESECYSPQGRHWSLNKRSRGKDGEMGAALGVSRQTQVEQTVRQHKRRSWGASQAWEFEQEQ